MCQTLLFMDHAVCFYRSNLFLYDKPGGISNRLLRTLLRTSLWKKYCYCDFIQHAMVIYNLHSGRSTPFVTGKMLKYTTRLQFYREKRKTQREDVKE